MVKSSRVIRVSVSLHTHTHIHLTTLFPGLPRWAGTRKVEPIWILLKQKTMSGSGISWDRCKSAPCSRPASHHSRFFYRPDALPATQPTASKYWISNYSIGKKLNFPISCANLHFNLVWFLVCLLVMTVSAPEMAEPIELLFGGRLVWIKPCITRLGPCWQIGGLQV